MMIRIHVIYKNHMISSISIFGHANYSAYGKDIVCAAVSATYLCTVNGILKLDNNSISVNSNEDMQEIDVNSDDKVVMTLLQNMIECFSDLEKQFPKNIKLDKEEE